MAVLADNISQPSTVDEFVSTRPSIIHVAHRIKLVWVGFTTRPGHSYPKRPHSSQLEAILNTIVLYNAT